ncbi:MAG: 8-oxo-dGTP diphosphatase MutT [Gammaproteobacteria bacterium]|nr:8-oxo-dGTP diphosphatase MutT [Gammaproteobacteria bacterium]
MKKIHAAIGIIFNQDTQNILVTKRRSEQVYAGYWELPGGKIEINESSLIAVVRELKEELGITIITAEFLNTVNYQYPEFLVTLEVFKITDYSGIAHGREGQEITWVDLKNINNISPLLPASQDILSLLI